MAKKVLIVHYSQSGQLSNIVNSFVNGLKNSEVEIDYLKVEPQTPFPFPWTRLTFFNTFPESVFGIEMPLKKMEVDHTKNYDLIILAYTVWYMSPSIPINSFLMSEEGKRLMKGKKVVTLIGARNMWVMAQEKMKGILKNLDATLVGNIALVDRNSNLVSIVTIIRWMFYGKKDPFWGFPRAGILQSDIDSAATFGEVVQQDICSDELKNLNNHLLLKGAVHIDPALLVLEKRASKIFKLYAGFIHKKGEYDDPARLGRVSFLSYLIPVGAFILSPLTALGTFVVSIVKRKEVEAEIEHLKSASKIG